MIVLAEKAGAELAVGGEPDAGAMAAERLSDRGDEADFAEGAVSEAVLASGLTALVGDLLERPARVDAPVDLRGGDYQVALPVPGPLKTPSFHKTPHYPPITPPPPHTPHLLLPSRTHPHA